MAGSEIYQFAEFRLDVPERRLSRAGEPVSLAPKSHDLLVALLRNAGRLVTKRELLDQVWTGSFVEEGILAVHISTLRKALGQHPGRRFIETVSRAGYRFIEPVVNPPEAFGKPWSLAVLPARSHASETLAGWDDATGLTLSDALTDRLGRLPDVIVRPTRAVRQYLNSGDDPASIGRTLRVDAVIDSHLLGTAERVRVSVYLIRSQDGATLWSGNFDETAAHLIQIVDRVAECIATRHGTGVLPGPTRPAQRPEVYEWFGRGRSHLLSASMFEVSKAVDAFRAAIALDSSYAPAHAGLALAYCAQAALRLAPPREAYSEAKAAALRALAMDSSCADAQVALGAVLFFSEWHWHAAERSLQRALELNPNHSEAYLLYGQVLGALGRLAEGLRMKMRALERDPFSPLVHLQISLSCWNQRRYDDAIRWATKTLELDPCHPHAREHLAAAYLKKGDHDRYLAENLKHAELHGVPAEILERLTQLFAKQGPAGMRDQVLQRAAREPDAFPAVQLALFYGEAGDLDSAFRHLDRAIDNHDPCLVFMAVAPQWDALRGDPRFDQSLARIGLAQTV